MSRIGISLRYSSCISHNFNLIHIHPPPLDFISLCIHPLYSSSLFHNSCSHKDLFFRSSRFCKLYQLGRWFLSMSMIQNRSLWLLHDKLGRDGKNLGIGHPAYSHSSWGRLRSRGRVCNQQRWGFEWIEDTFQEGGKDEVFDTEEDRRKHR